MGARLLYLNWREREREKKKWEGGQTECTEPMGSVHDLFSLSLEHLRKNPPSPHPQSKRLGGKRRGRDEGCNWFCVPIEHTRFALASIWTDNTDKQTSGMLSYAT